MGWLDDLGDNIVEGVNIDAGILGDITNKAAVFTGKLAGNVLNNAGKGLLGDDWLLIVAGILGIYIVTK